MSNSSTNIVPAQDPYRIAKEAIQRENPRSWVWDDDGDELAGTLIGDDTGTTRDGDEVPIKLFRTQDGEIRSLWLFKNPKMLPELFAEKNTQSGDFCIVRRYPKRKTQDGERSYWPFALAVVPANPSEAEHNEVPIEPVADPKPSEEGEEKPPF